MATNLERTLLISNITLNIVGIGSTALSVIVDTPEWVLPAGITALGVGVVWALCTYVPFNGSAVARNLTLGLTALIAAVLVGFTWPDRPNSVPGNSPSAASTKSSWEKTVARLKKSIEPGHHASIECKIAVSGTGWIPDHFDIWTAILNDANGTPDTSRLFGLEKAVASTGDSWATKHFSVGVPKPKNKHYWIYVYLVHEDASSVLSNVVPREGSQKPTLDSPIERATLLDRIPVERAADATC
ncbi:hypothetical protein F8R89_06630 [Streptomyces sp. SS1-1]|uniref:hypothetical protein n=1 Tax=Streptomyces sp. SS1-1 TaxID=2651869 RepID=UPI00124FE46F|nr:hypothetical protein [Streptomyces sp. SS1-1]KAB2971752.1 hypothetical protein F8R89_06630 [Streptomyces sp. SS1-1]